MQSRAANMGFARNRPTRRLQHFSLPRRHPPQDGRATRIPMAKEISNSLQQWLCFDPYNIGDNWHAYNYSYAIGLHIIFCKISIDIPSSASF
jgi:hypothetical protein